MKKAALLLLFFPVLLFAQPAWNAFDGEIFRKAEKEHKWVLLHLRANWCHWCHVMEEKTYGNKRMADTIGKYFVPAMEDHDARPDLTARYKEYGWPATIIFDEHGKELYKAAGYISVEEFYEVINDLKAGRTETYERAAESRLPGENESGRSLAELKKRFYESLDLQSGGFVFGQKYIDFETFEYALNHYREDPKLKRWLKKSIDNSAGLYDKSWGGIYQYSTHNDWKHPHYEKLLSIQARYIKMYCWYFKTFGDSLALKRASGTARYVNRFLKAKTTGYYNAQDADLVQGEKAHAYFALPDHQRMKLGVPKIDTNVYTAENAQLAESFIYLWACTGNTGYLADAQRTMDFLLTDRRSESGLFLHGTNYSATISISDNLYMAKTLLLLFRATGNKKYYDESYLAAQRIMSTFWSGKHYFFSYTGNSALEPLPVISENIEATRLLNLYRHVFSDTLFGVAAKECMKYMVSQNLLEEITTEPGIISAQEEQNGEPLSGVYLVYDHQADERITCEVTGRPLFYFSSGTYDENNVPGSKRYLYDAFDKNVVLFCTSSFCSAPMFSIEEVKAFKAK